MAGRKKAAEIGASPLEGKGHVPVARTPAELKKLQEEGLRATVSHAYQNSPFYRKKLDAQGIRPEQIRTLRDLEWLPFTSAEDLVDDYPLPLLSVPVEEVVRIHSSSGTTELRKILAYTRNDLLTWRELFARSLEVAEVGRGDRVQIAAGFGIWTAGAGFQEACEAVGAMGIPVGSGNLDLQCRFLMDLKPTVICCTASMGLLLAEEIGRRQLKDRINVKKMIQGGERCNDAMRRRICEQMGVEEIFDITGMTELYGPGMGIECKHHSGIHFWNDAYILEILDPKTLKPVKEGEVGEMVITSLKKEAAPLLRYRTHDLTRIIPGRCGCGLHYPRHARLLGRDDDMFVFRAVNIYPGQLEEILSSFEGLSSEYSIVLERKYGKDFMTIQVEREPTSDPLKDERIEAEISHKIKNLVLVSVDVQVVDFMTLPRSSGRAQRVFDKR